MESRKITLVLFSLANPPFGEADKQTISTTQNTHLSGHVINKALHMPSRREELGRRRRRRKVTRDPSHSHSNPAFVESIGFRQQWVRSRSITVRSAANAARRFWSGAARPRSPEAAIHHEPTLRRPDGLRGLPRMESVGQRPERSDWAQPEPANHLRVMMIS